MRRRRYAVRRRRRKRRRPRRLTIKKLLGRGVSRPYKDKNRLMLGSGNKASKQRGGFFPLAAALTAAPPIIDLLGKIIR